MAERIRKENERKRRKPSVPRANDKAERREKKERTLKRRQSTMSRDEAVAAIAKLGLSTRDEGSSKSKVGVAAPGAADDMAPTLEKVQSL